MKINSNFRCTIFTINKVKWSPKYFRTNGDWVGAPIAKSIPAIAAEFGGVTFYRHQIKVGSSILPCGIGIKQLNLIILIAPLIFLSLLILFNGIIYLVTKTNFYSNNYCWIDLFGTLIQLVEYLPCKQETGVRFS